MSKAYFSNFESSTTNNGRAIITKNMGRKGVLSKTDNIKKQKKFRVGYAEQKVATYCQKSFTPRYMFEQSIVMFLVNKHYSTEQPV